MCFLYIPVYSCIITSTYPCPETSAVSRTRLCNTRHLEKQKKKAFESIQSV